MCRLHLLPAVPYSLKAGCIDFLLNPPWLGDLFLNPQRPMAEVKCSYSVPRLGLLFSSQVRSFLQKWGVQSLCQACRPKIGFEMLCLYCGRLSPWLDSLILFCEHSFAFSEQLLLNSFLWWKIQFSCKQHQWFCSFIFLSGRKKNKRSCVRLEMQDVRHQQFY